MAFGEQGSGFRNQLVPFFEAGNTVIINKIGLFEYNGKPTFGNLVNSVVPPPFPGGTDKYGNAYLAGITNYQATSPTQLFSVNLADAATLYYYATSAGGPWHIIGGLEPGFLNFPSLEGPNIGVVGASFGMAGALYLIPSGDNTGVTDSANINAMMTGFGGLVTPTNIILGAGTFYLASPITMSGQGTCIRGRGTGGTSGPTGVSGTLLMEGSSWAGSALILPTADNIEITDLAFATSLASFIDFQNTNIQYLTVGNVVGTASSTAPDIITNFNLHRSTFERCELTQNNPGTTILTMGASGSGLSTTTFRDCRFIATCAAGSVSVSGNRTVPAINILVPGNKNLDIVKFEDCFCNNAKNGTNIDNGQYFMSFACTEGGASHDEDRLYFENVSFNQVLGGAIQCQSIVGVSAERVSVGNVASVAAPIGTKQTANSFLNFGTFAGGQHSQAITVTDFERESTANFTSGVNPSDMQFSSDTVDVYIHNPHVPDTGGNIQIDFGGCTDANLVCANTNIVFVNTPGTGSTLAGGILTVYRASGSVAFSVNGGQPQTTDAAGFPQNLSGSQLSSVDTTSVTGTALTALGHRSIPASSVNAGSAHRIKASGSFTFGATPPSTATFSVWWGGIAGTQIASLQIPAADMPAGAVVQAGWWVDAEVEWLATTATEVTLKVGWHSGSGVGASVTLFATIDTSALVTTGANNLTLAFQWGSAPASTQLQTNVVRVGRVA